MPGTEERRPKKVRIKEPFIEDSDLVFENQTHENFYVDTADNDMGNQGSAYADVDPEVDWDVLNEVEERGLSVRLPLKPGDVEATSQAAVQKASINVRRHSGNVFDAWRASEMTISAMAAEVKMSSIYSVRVSGEYSQHERIDIICDSGPSGGPSPQEDLKLWRWMHIKKSSLSLETLQKFVMACPFISHELRHVAKELLSKVDRTLTTTTDHGSRVGAGTIIRYVGILPHMTSKRRIETEPVVFASCPHLVLEDRKPSFEGHGQTPQTLVHHLHGHGFEFSSDKYTQVVGKLKEIIHVNEMWCLLIGSDCLITYSPNSASELQDGLIDMSPLKTPDQGFLNMILIDDNDLRLNGVIGQDWTYAELLQYAVGMIKNAPWEARDFYLERPQGCRLSAKSWLELATSGSTDLGIFYIRKAEYVGHATPSSDSSTPRRPFAIPKSDPRRIFESSNCREPSVGNRLRNNSRASSGQDNPPIKTEVEGLRRRSSTDSDPKIESQSIGFGEHQNKSDNESPSRSSPVATMSASANERGFSPDGEIINTESVGTKNILLKPKIYTPSPDGEDHWESSSNSSARTMSTDEVQDDSLQLDLHNICSWIASDRRLVPITKPFFEWRHAGATTKRSTNEIIKDIDSILDQLHSDMMNGGNGDINSAAFRCKPGVLWLRNNFLPFHEDISSRSLRGIGQVSIERDFYETLGANTEDEDCVNTDVTTPDSKDQVRVLDSSEDVKRLMSTLFQISCNIISLFLPCPTKGHGDHDVLELLWGALDTICRQLNWAFFHNQEHQTSHYIVRDFDPFATYSDPFHTPLSGSFLSWSQCERCSQRELYSSIESALDHLHREHFMCGNDQPGQHPFDDPCYVWILHVARAGHRRLKYPPLVTLTKGFIADLRGLHQILKELHALVARPSESADAERSIPPLLPSNLMLAFGGIVNVYIIYSNQLSLMNRLEYLNGRLTRERPRGSKSRGKRLMMATEKRRIAAFTSAREFLAFTQRDVMELKHTPREVDHIAFEAVGLEFLTLALMSNVQKRPILSESIINIEDIYRIKMSRMRSEASRRPKRRLFLDLNALQEELDAASGIIEIQQNLLHNYLNLSAPGSFRNLKRRRLRLYPLERKFAESYERALHERHERLNSLQERATGLRELVKQTIEVLEENHGKAIRVFTIVTLFFLPMSFISSFMGMNTTDIRDTEFDQRFFWIVSIPVTAVVVILAMTYGYKGDDINDWIYQKMHQRRQKLSRVMRDVHHADQSEARTASPSGGIRRSRTMEVEQQLLQMRRQNSRGSRVVGRRSAM